MTDEFDGCLFFRKSRSANCFWNRSRRPIWIIRIISHVLLSSCFPSTVSTYLIHLMAGPYTCFPRRCTGSDPSLRISTRHLKNRNAYFLHHFSTRDNHHASTKPFALVRTNPSIGFSCWKLWTNGSIVLQNWGKQVVNTLVPMQTACTRKYCGIQIVSFSPIHAWFG